MPRAARIENLGFDACGAGEDVRFPLSGCRGLGIWRLAGTHHVDKMTR